MVAMDKIEMLGRRIGEKFHPKRVILFGSYAEGVPTEDSDVDLLIVIPFEGKSWRLAGRIRDAIGPQFPLDLLVRSQEQIDRRLEIGDSFLKNIVEKGRVLYEAAD